MQNFNMNYQLVKPSNFDSTASVPALPLFRSRNNLSSTLKLRVRNWRSSPPGSQASMDRSWWEPLSFSSSPVVFDSSIPPLPQFKAQSIPSFKLRTRDWYSRSKFNSNGNYDSSIAQLDERHYQTARDLYLTRSSVSDQSTYADIQSHSFGHSFVPVAPPLPSFNQFRQHQSQLSHPHRARNLKLRSRSWKSWNGSEAQCAEIDQRRDQLFRQSFFMPASQTDTYIVSETVTAIPNGIVTTSTTTTGHSTTPITVIPLVPSTGSNNNASSNNSTTSGKGKAFIGKIRSSLLRKNSNKAVTENSNSSTRMQQVSYVDTTGVANNSTSTSTTYINNNVNTNTNTNANAPVKARKSAKIRGLLKQKVGHATHNAAMEAEGKQIQQEQQQAQQLQRSGSAAL